MSKANSVRQHDKCSGTTLDEIVETVLDYLGPCNLLALETYLGCFGRNLYFFSKGVVG
jgi:hypothetical protein